MTDFEAFMNSVNKGILHLLSLSWLITSLAQQSCLLKLTSRLTNYKLLTAGSLSTGFFKGPVWAP